MVRVARFLLSVYGPGGPGSRLALELFSTTKRTTTGDSEYTYAYGASTLSYSLSHVTEQHEHERHGYV